MFHDLLRGCYTKLGNAYMHARTSEKNWCVRGAPYSVWRAAGKEQSLDVYVYYPLQVPPGVHRPSKLALQKNFVTVLNNRC